MIIPLSSNSESQKFFPKKWAGLILDICLVLIILIGLYYRFNWRDWSQGTNLHPDEYGLTSTLTQLSFPESLESYFNTRASPISPYQKYDLWGNPTVNGPDNRMRWGQWPIIIIRFMAEVTSQTGYNEIRLLGRTVSAIADSLTLLLLFVIGVRLYEHRVALLATVLSALAVMQIQQSHFMTVDNFSILFSMLAFYSAVRVAEGGLMTRQTRRSGASFLAHGEYRPTPRALLFHASFGIALGMALASRVNLFPLAILLPMASFLGIADLKLKSGKDLRRILILAVGFLMITGLVSLITFRLTQPMSFRARSGDTGIFTFSLNPDWVDSMEVAQNESRGIGGGPPSEQWANRPAILFSLINMVVWGMGLPLGIAAWSGFSWAAWKTMRNADAWRIHILPLLWVGGYFFFMGTRFVKSMRYFLPVYPFLCLFAGWLLYEIWRRRNAEPVRSGQSPQQEKPINPRGHIRTIVPAFISGIVISGTFLWSSAFVRAVYLEDHTRIRASRWIYDHIPPRSVISNESWDEGLPLPLDGYNPYGGMYEGVVMEVRWYDSEDKREMFLNSLDQADYTILPSQRSIWSISRIPMTYPMTMEYYRALFDGRLGFDLVAVFTSPIEIGPLKISDVGGTVAWNAMPELPLFNDNLLAAEEAFSVYDHPPVWVFKKRDDFNARSVRAFFYTIDLSQVVIQSPAEATKRINN